MTISSNLSLLGFFKYFNFATESWTALMTMLGLPDLGFDLAFKITLPLGHQLLHVPVDELRD